MIAALRAMLQTVPSCAGGNCNEGRACPMPETCARGILARAQERCREQMREAAREAATEPAQFDPDEQLAAQAAGARMCGASEFGHTKDGDLIEVKRSGFPVDIDTDAGAFDPSPAPRVPRIRPGLEVRGGERLIFAKLTPWRRLVWAWREWRTARMRPAGAR